ncbi:hypothetical protein Avbf_05847 [Armadillidium vulgare]|nr:hypothetical protein Avbf_05847 [Armadillidium vulgare]
MYLDAYTIKDESLDQNALNSFLWPSYLKKEIEESVETQEKSGEKSQSSETLQSKNPIILEQCQSEDYKEKLRPREESMNARKKLRSRLSKRSVSKNLTDDGNLEKRSNNNESKVSGSRNEQNNSNEKNKNSGNFKLKSNSSLETFKKDNLKIKKFKCDYCSYKTKYERSYNAHCAKHKNVKLFKCNSCDFETNYESDLIRHNFKHCSEVSKLNSTRNCDNQLENSNYFSLSLSEVMLLIYNKRKLLDANTSIPSPAEPLKFSECNFEAEDQNCLDLHSQIHSQVHKCPECSYKSTDTETFKDHLIKIHLCHFKSESESVPYSLRKRSRQPNKTVTDESSDEENKKSQDSEGEIAKYWRRYVG